MILYLDASALVKRYVAEAGAPAVEALLVTTDLTGTSLISRAEVSAAICKAARMGAVDFDAASKSVTLFRAQWPTLFRLKVDGLVMERADMLAWVHHLRGYDAVHLASALLWQASLAEIVTLATFDRDLWAAGRQAGLDVWPTSL